MSAKENRTIAIVNGSASYQTLQRAFANINNMISSGKHTIIDKEISNEFFLGGDYKFIF